MSARRASEPAPGCLSACCSSEPKAVAQTFPQHRQVAGFRKCHAGPLDLEAIHGAFHHKHKVVSDDSRKPDSKDVDTSRARAAFVEAFARTPRRGRVGNVLNGIFNEEEPKRNRQVTDSNLVKATKLGNFISSSAANNDDPDGAVHIYKQPSSNLMELFINRDVLSSQTDCGSSSPSHSGKSMDCCSTEYIDDLSTGHSNSRSTSKSSIHVSAEEMSKKKEELDAGEKDQIDSSSETVILSMEDGQSEKAISAKRRGILTEQNVVESAVCSFVESDCGLPSVYFEVPSTDGEMPSLENSDLDGGSSHGELLKSLRAYNKYLPTQPSPPKSQCRWERRKYVFHWRRMSRMLSEQSIKSAHRAPLANLPRLLGSKKEYVIEKGKESNGNKVCVPSPTNKSGQIATRAARQAKQSFSSVAALKARIKTSAWRSVKNSDRVEPSWVQIFFFVGQCR
jgi:hypothetical protein